MELLGEETTETQKKSLEEKAKEDPLCKEIQSALRTGLTVKLNKKS